MNPVISWLPAPSTAARKGCSPKRGGALVGRTTMVRRCGSDAPAAVHSPPAGPAASPESQWGDVMRRTSMEAFPVARGAGCTRRAPEGDAVGGDAKRAGLEMSDTMYAVTLKRCDAPLIVKKFGKVRGGASGESVWKMLRRGGAVMSAEAGVIEREKVVEERLEFGGADGPSSSMSTFTWKSPARSGATEYTSAPSGRIPKAENNPEAGCIPDSAATPARENDMFCDASNRDPGVTSTANPSTTCSPADSAVVRFMSAENAGGRLRRMTSMVMFALVDVLRCP
mmetsp:Transcript_64139/g.153015  ORF Transcript_64139/g.153015 Transcript_64139/m.153015 type:complete len:283 (-) Transcript_64139:1207-2055(-)